MPKYIAILEDNVERATAMKSVLCEQFEAYTAIFHDNAPDLIEWLGVHLIDTVLICLDHDLGPNRDRSSGSFDPGTGRDVADFLGGCLAVCPVVIHSSNAMAVPGMLRVLREGGWFCSAVVPAEDVQWIARDWSGELSRLRDTGLMYG